MSFLFSRYIVEVNSEGWNVVELNDSQKSDLRIWDIITALIRLEIILDRQQVGYQQSSQQQGMSCFAHTLEDNNGVLAPSTTYGHGTFRLKKQ